MGEPPAEADQPECNGSCGSKNADRKAQNMDCAALLAKINELTDMEKAGRMGTKGLLQRFRDYRGDDATHGPAIENQQRSLRSYNNAYKDKGCGDPPPLAQEMADKKLPAAQASTGQNVAKSVAIAGGTVGAGYIAYRVVRMLPSLFPPLWETIPVNLAVP